jgi:hypothetical protein
MVLQYDMCIANLRQKILPTIPYLSFLSPSILSTSNLEPKALYPEAYNLIESTQPKFWKLGDEYYLGEKYYVHTL